MIHLSEEELMRLAEAAQEQMFYSERELEMLNHLKTCTACYEKFCSALVLLEVTGESGYLFLSGHCGMEHAGEPARREENRILAVVNFVRNKFSENINAVLEQAERAGAAFQFRPVATAAARGLSDIGSHIYKVEDDRDPKTFLMVDPDSRALLLQINTKQLGDLKIRAFLRTEQGETIEIPMERKGKLYKGLLNQLPSDTFRIVIEQADA